MTGHRLHCLAAFILMTLIAPTLFATSAEREAKDFTVKVMTFNIRNGAANDGEDSWPYRSREVIKTLIGSGSEKKPEWEIAGLQEVFSFQLGQIKAGIEGYAVVGVGRDDGAQAGEFSPILYRKDRFVLEESGTFWLSETPDKPGTKSWDSSLPRICTWARLADLKQGGVILVMNTHWDHRGQDAREHSAALIAQKAKELRHGADAFVLTGDFNSDEDNRAIRYLKGELDLTYEDGTKAPASPEYIDSWREKNPDEKARATFNEFKINITEDKKIDYVFVEKGTEVLKAKIDRRLTDKGRAVSDHYPVTAVLRFKTDN